MIKPIIKATHSNPLTREETDELRFSLYLKNRKVQQISDIMDQMLLWSEKDLATWSEKFSPEIQMMLDGLIDEAVEVFDGVTLDSELMEAFAEFTENLKVVTQQVQSVLAEETINA